MTRQRHPRTTTARGEDGYAMVVTVTIVLILTMLMVVVLSQALHNNTASSFETRRSRSLGVAEAGVHWAIARLQANPSAVVGTNSVTVADPVVGGGSNGTATVTVRQGTPASPGRLGYYTIYATGRVAEQATPTRTLRVTMGPPASFTYALYADSSLTLDQNTCIVGTVYAKQDIAFKGKATIAGTTKARGSLISQGEVDFSGGKPQCPATVDGEAVDTTNDVHGDALATNLSPCRSAPAGRVTLGSFDGTVGGRVCDDAPPYTMPEYTFNPGNYSPVTYFGRPPGVGSASATAVVTGNAALAVANVTGLNGAYVIWQDLTGYQAAGTTPPAVNLDVGALRIAGDTVIYTNVPVDFGNNSTVVAANTACSTQDPTPSGAVRCPILQVISTYAASPCTGGDVESCPSITGKNQVEADPKVAMLLYSHDGTIQFKNGCNGPKCDDSNNGAWYADRIEGKNNLNISYSARIANALGFGRTQLQQVAWQELAPCPAGQTPPSTSTTC